MKKSQDNSIIATAIPDITANFHSLYDVVSVLLSLRPYSCNVGAKFSETYLGSTTLIPTSPQGWYASAYLLTTSSFELPFSTFYTFYNIKHIFLLACLVFEIGSLICATSPTSVALIIGRAIAGIGAAGIFTGAYVIIACSVPLAKRPAYTGMLGSMYGVASAAGPLMGGAFNDHLSWRWCL